MERLTKKLEPQGHTVPPGQVTPVPDGYAGEAIERLARFENFYCDLLRAQTEYTAELDALKREDKTRSVRFRELMGKKLQNADILIRLKYYGLE